MARQSISLTKPNDECLKAQVDKEEYTSKSELVNDLISVRKKTPIFQALIRKGQRQGFCTALSLSAARQACRNEVFETKEFT